MRIAEQARSIAIPPNRKDSSVVDGKFQMESFGETVHGHRYFNDDARPAECGSAETSLFAFAGDRIGLNLSAWIFFEPRCDFAYEVTNRNACNRWRRSHTDPDNWHLDAGDEEIVPMHFRCRSTILSPAVLREAYTAHQGRDHSPTRPPKSILALPVDHAYFSRDHSVWRHVKYKPSFLSKPIHFLYETSHPAIVFSIGKDGLVYGFVHSRTSFEDSLTKISIDAKEHSMAGVFAIDQLSPIEQHPGLAALIKCIVRRMDG